MHSAAHPVVICNGGNVTKSFYLFIAGLLLLLFGLRCMQSGLVDLSSKRLQHLLQSLSANPLRASLAGLITSALTQSSTAVSVLIIGLVHSRLLHLRQGIAVILGANVGTSLTVQFLAADPGKLALPLLGAGAVLWCLPFRALGRVICGAGMIFSGLALMSAAMAPLEHASWFTGLLTGSCSNPLLAVTGAALLTAFLHSSSVATAIVITVYAESLITLDAAIALILGNNIGTCFTALIASVSSSAAGRRVAAAHLLLNVIGAVLCLPLIHSFGLLVGATTGDPARQVANAHTIYNVLSSLAALPFCRPFAGLLTRLLPDRPIS